MNYKEVDMAHRLVNRVDILNKMLVMLKNKSAACTFDIAIPDDEPKFGSVYQHEQVWVHRDDIHAYINTELEMALNELKKLGVSK